MFSCCMPKKEEVNANAGRAAAAAVAAPAGEKKKKDDDGAAKSSDDKNNNSNSSKKDDWTAEESKQRERLHALLEEPGNKFCADCAEPLRDAKPWASLNLGVFICMSCSGVHRSLGAEISAVRSVDLDKWTAEMVDGMRRTNVEVNETYEYSVPKDVLKPGLRSKMADRKAYITSKYVDKKFVKTGDEKQLRRAPTFARADGDGDEAGADEEEKGMVIFRGVVFIRLVQADGLPSMDVLSASDPYVKVMNPSMTQSATSKAVQNDNNPKFNETLQLCVKGLDSFLTFEVWDEDPLTKDDLIGVGQFDLRKLKGAADGEAVRFEEAVLSRGGKPVGKGATLTATITWADIMGD